MKALLLLLAVLVSLSVFAKKDVDLSKFNKEISKNFQEVLDQNPQIYEKKSPARGPASVSEEPDNKTRTESLDNFDEQATGPNEL